MFIKADQLKDLLPKDNLCHDLRIVNGCLEIDGEIVYVTTLEDSTYGKFSDIRVWDRELTRKEIQILANVKP